ncbi:MAG: nitroreductase family protein [Bacteroidota bacterium]
MALIDDLKWRYATKKMNGEKVDQEKVDYILEAARLAPTSSGLQPFKIFVITNPEKLEQIKAFAFNQSQITDCSHLLIWAAWDTYDDERVTDVLLQTSRSRGIPDEQTLQYKETLMGMYKTLDKATLGALCARQAYISLGMALTAAAEQKVDATPMEGFVGPQIDEFLGLTEEGLKSVVLMPIGYRDEANDWLVNLPKWRKPKEDLIVEIK